MFQLENWLMKSLRQYFFGKRQIKIYRGMGTPIHLPSWKLTLKILVKRLIFICSNQHLLQKEIDYLIHVSSKTNDSPSVRVENIIKNELQKANVNISNKPQVHTLDNNETKLQLSFLFSGMQSTQLLYENTHYIQKQKTFSTISCKR